MDRLAERLRAFFEDRETPPLVGLADFELGNEPDAPLSNKATDRPSYNYDSVGEVIGIEYQNASGEASRRWISILGFKQSKAKLWSVYAICLTKNKRCQFRLDRIQAVFNQDGEILEISDVFGIDPPTPEAVEPNGNSGIVLRRKCRDQLRIMIALAKIDGHLHPSEIEVILSYAESIAAQNHLPFQEAEQQTIERYIRNQHPSGEVIAASLKSLDQSDAFIQRDFLWYLRHLIDADRVQSSEEVHLLLNIADSLEHINI